jgi:hypothetical protein
MSSRKLDELSADLDDASLAYVVFYDYNPGSEHDYVYLPSAGGQWYEMNVRNISHGREGNWFRATAAWQGVARPLIAQRADR